MTEEKIEPVRQGILTMDCPDCGTAIVLPVARISTNPFAKFSCPNKFYGKCLRVFTISEIRGLGEIKYNENKF